MEHLEKRPRIGPDRRLVNVVGIGEERIEREKGIEVEVGALVDEMLEEPRDLLPRFRHPQPDRPKRLWRAQSLDPPASEQLDQGDVRHDLGMHVGIDGGDQRQGLHRRGVEGGEIRFQQRKEVQRGNALDAGRPNFFK